jgi:YceI-like domain
MAASTGTYRLGPDAGRVVIKTTRAGLAARVGHDLAIDVTRWSADITVPGAAAAESGGDDLTAATVSAELDLGSFVVREGTGGARPLTDSDRRDIESTMRKILGGGAATAAFQSTRVIPSSVGGAIEGTLTLNGRSQPVRLQLTAPAPGRYRGTVTVVQSAFGIKPYTGFFGALKLRDEVVAEFEVDLGRAAKEEAAPS